MINHLNNSNREIFLHISEGPDGVRIQPGHLLDSKAFDPKHAILVSKDKPNLLWDLLYNLMGIPHPELPAIKDIKGPEIPKITESKEIKHVNFHPYREKILTPLKEEPKFSSPLEEELNKLKGWEIVEKVMKEKGVAITCSLKSKKSIIKRALEIYLNQPIDF